MKKGSDTWLLKGILYARDHCKKGVDIKVWDGNMTTLPDGSTLELGDGQSKEYRRLIAYREPTHTMHNLK